ncbi:MAG: hypothetical protein HKP55_00265 [Gammaproteobacteria bacterium]|nr:hypothetical protein [Gammaproteobacteria bacterium]
MEITITLRDIENGQVEIEETRLPYSGETVDSVTTASALADELRKCATKLGQIETTTCEIPVSDDQTGEWE